MSEADLDPEIFIAVLWGLEAQRARLDAQIAEVRQMTRTRARPQKLATLVEPTGPKRRISAAERRRIAEATKRRWAEFHRKMAEAVTKAEGLAAAKRAASKKTTKKSVVKGTKKAVAKAAKKPVAVEGAAQ